MNPRRWTSVPSLAVSFVLVGCSSSPSSSAAPPAATPACTAVDGDPDCKGTFEYSCVGGGNPTDLAAKTLTCPAGAPLPDGSTRYCCTGFMTSITVPACSNGSGIDGQLVSYVATSDVSTDTLVALAPGAQCFTRAPDGAGHNQYCCTSGFINPAGGGLNACIVQPATDSTGTCSSGAVPVFCSPGGANSPEITPKGLNCDNGAGTTWHGQSGALFCCNDIDTGCTAKGPGASVPTSFGTNCSASATAYHCGGVERPDEAPGATVTCGAGGTTYDSAAPANGNVVDYCCLDWAPGPCQPAPVNGCVGVALHGFSCTGSSTPTQAVPSLRCSAPTMSATGDTLYCCAE